MVRKTGLPQFATRGGTAVVTGANSGIGAESAKALLEAGCRVVLCSRDAEAGMAALAAMGPVSADRARVQQVR